MNDTQVVITVGYTIVFVLSLAGLWVLVRSTRRRRAPAPGHDQLAAGEVRWGYAVALALVALTALTIWQVPYGDTQAAGPAQEVRVVGQQFAWAVRPNVVRAGEPVDFELISRDVQHGFGVYDGSKLLFQVQVPAKGESPQRTTYTFEHPGNYDILCLEFCGFQHHLMRGTLRVR